MTTASIRRRSAAPIALFAALALAAGGGSSPWSIGPSPAERAVVRAAAQAGVAAVHLEHVELVALRAQSIPSGTTR